MIRSIGTVMAKTRSHSVKSDTNDDILELAPAVPHQVAETTWLVRLTPIGNDLSTSSRQVAIVAAETEDQARRLACAFDPFGRDWKNASLFAADTFEDACAHVVGDVIFKSAPSPRPRASEEQERKTKAE